MAIGPRRPFTSSSPERHCLVTLSSRLLFKGHTVRSSIALSMMLLAAYAVATLQWWGCHAGTDRASSRRLTPAELM